MWLIDAASGELGNAGIDWSQPQPPGTYRCANGWESGGYQYGCQNRGVLPTEDDILYCHGCAVVMAIQTNTEAIREATRQLSPEYDTNDRADNLIEAIDRVGDYLQTMAWYAAPRPTRWWIAFRTQCREYPQRWRSQRTGQKGWTNHDDDA